MKIREGHESLYEDYKKTNEGDPYGHEIVNYGERWAGMMEARIEAGEHVKDIAEETGQKADTEGITGFMYGCAVQALSQFWAYGEELRVWHNKHYDHEGEGVVNPAIIIVGEKE